MTGAESIHELFVQKVGRRRTWRHGRFARHYAARCTCGWRGPGRVGRLGLDLAFVDLDGHRADVWDAYPGFWPGSAAGQGA